MTARTSSSGGIEHVGRLIEGHAEAVLGIQSAGDSDEHLCEVGVDSPISGFVGVGQSTSGDLCSDASVIEFGLHSPQTGFDVPKAFAKGQLSKGHAKKLVQTGEGLDTMVAVIATDTTPEVWQRYEIDQLGKDDASGVHWPILSASSRKMHGQSLRMISSRSP